MKKNIITFIAYLDYSMLARREFSDVCKEVNEILGGNKLNFIDKIVLK